MKYEENVQRLLNDNGPSATLLEDTVQLMKEEQWAQFNEPIPPKKQHKLLKRLSISLASVAAAFALLVGVGAVFPAFAQELPLIGGILRQMWGFGNNGPTYENLVQPVNVSEETERYSVTVEDTYSDGNYLFFSLRLLSDDPEINRMDGLYLGYADGVGEGTFDRDISPVEDAQVWINGIGVEIDDSLAGGIYLRRVEDHFEGAVTIPLSEPAKNGQILQTRFSWASLIGYNVVEMEANNTAFLEHNYAGPEKTVEFEAKVNTEYNQSMELEALSVDGLTLESWEATPATIRLTYSYPYCGQVQPIPYAVLEDGTMLEWLPVNYGEEHFEQIKDLSYGDRVTDTFGFNGAPADAGKVIVRIVNTHDWLATVNGGKMYEAVFGEFTVDLKARTAEVTETYKNEQFEHLSIEEYAADVERGPAYKSHVFVPAYGLSQFYGWWPWGEEAPIDNALEFDLNFVSDTTENLNMEARFYLDNELLAAVPIAPANYEEHERGTGWNLENGDGMMGENWVSTVMCWADYGEPFRWTGEKLEYTIRVGKPDVRPEGEVDYKWGKSYWTEHGGYVLLVNTETGETVYDSREPVEILFAAP